MCKRLIPPTKTIFAIFLFIFDELYWKAFLEILIKLVHTASLQRWTTYASYKVFKGQIGVVVPIRMGESKIKSLDLEILADSFKEGYQNTGTCGSVMLFRQQLQPRMSHLIKRYIWKDRDGFGSNLCQSLNLFLSSIVFCHCWNLKFTQLIIFSLELLLYLGLCYT
jgi:hypothetical protein